jgi:hypothetical protein
MQYYNGLALSQVQCTVELLGVTLQQTVDQLQLMELEKNQLVEHMIQLRAEKAQLQFYVKIGVVVGLVLIGLLA